MQAEFSLGDQLQFNHDPGRHANLAAATPAAALPHRGPAAPQPARREQADRGVSALR